MKCTRSGCLATQWGDASPYQSKPEKWGGEAEHKVAIIIVPIASRAGVLRKDKGQQAVFTEGRQEGERTQLKVVSFKTEGR